MTPSTTLVTTLGGQPQIVTFLLDLLIERGEPINQVVVAHLGGNPRYQRSFELLRSEFSRAAVYTQRRISLRAVEIRAQGGALPDAVEPAQVEAARQVIQSLLANLKDQGHTVHLGLSGGRRIMSLVAIAAAMQYLTPADHLWHIYTPDEVAERARGGALFHVPPGSGLRLIEVPFVPWAAYFPGLAPLLERRPREVNAAFGWLEEDERRRCQVVWDELTLRQRDVLRLLVQGLGRKECASRLGIQPSTFDTHRENILARCERAWSADSLVFSPRDLQDKFRLFVTSLDSV